MHHFSCSISSLLINYKGFNKVLTYDWNRLALTNMLKQSLVNSINNQLEDIVISDTRVITLEDLDDSSAASESYSLICKNLLDLLHPLDNRVCLVSSNDNLSVGDIYTAIKDAQPDFLQSASLQKFRLISFLCTHLQVRHTILMGNRFMIQLNVIFFTDYLMLHSLEFHIQKNVTPSV